MFKLTFLIILTTNLFNNINNYRLPPTPTPTNYYIELQLNPDIFETNKYDGLVNITINTNNQNINSIKLHINNLTISSAQLTIEQTIITFDINKFHLNDTTDILTIPLDETINNNNLLLTIYYTGNLQTNQMNGFYKSSYKNSDGLWEYLATTQFEPTHARKAFPCFDEPIFKSTFEFTIIYPINYQILTNTKPIDTYDFTTELKQTTFEKTPKMPTYLLAFILSNFTCTPGVPSGNTALQICSRLESDGTRDLALDYGTKLLNELEIYTNITFDQSEISKLDQIAIPDFSAGAMENWGLITYRETALLWNADESSNYYKQRVITVIAHELTHQWFGNLVTLNWWSNVFLNEGFATYFEYFISSNLLKDWDFDKLFIINELHEALDFDDKLSVVPLSIETNSQLECSSRFNTISYSKGASVLRMVERVMGEDQFRMGLQDYLNTFKFSNTVPNDLWNVLDGYVSLSIDRNLSEIMDNWVNEAGFPLITVTVDGDDVVLTQERFLNSGKSDTKWYVPITYTTSNDTTEFSNTIPKLWLTPEQNSIKIINIFQNSEWIILNNQQSAYYRVNYDQLLWDKIAKALNNENFNEINQLNRAQIIDDLFHLAQINLLKYQQIFEYLIFLKQDIDYFTWSTAFKRFSYILQRTNRPEIRDALSNHILTTARKLINSVPISQEIPDNQIYTQKQVLAQTWACNLGDSECVSTSTYEYIIYKTTNKRPNKNFRTYIYCTALRFSSNIIDDWEFLWNQFLNTKIATEQVTILSALGCTKNATILNNYLSLSIDENSGIRKQDASSVFSSVYSSNPDGVNIALDFFINEYQNIVQYYSAMNAVTSLITGLVGRFTSQEQIDKFEKFVDSGKLDDNVAGAARSAIASAKTNLLWIQNYEEQLANYFGVGSNSMIFTYNFILLLTSVILLKFL